MERWRGLRIPQSQSSTTDEHKRQRKTEERASQMWAVLALAARNPQVLSYSMMTKLAGMATPGVGHMLEPVQSYCLLKNLPPLAALVVNDSTGLPGAGFIAAAGVPKALVDVFAYA